MEEKELDPRLKKIAGFLERMSEKGIRKPKKEEPPKKKTMAGKVFDAVKFFILGMGAMSLTLMLIERLVKLFAR